MPNEPIGTTVAGHGRPDPEADPVALAALAALAARGFIAVDTDGIPYVVIEE